MLTGTRRNRFLLWGISSLIIVGVVGWILSTNLRQAHFLPPVSSDISASPGLGDWPMAQRDLSHSAFEVEGNSPAGGRLKWSFKTSAAIFSSPAVVGDYLYLSTGDKRVISLNVTSGEIQWEHHVSGPIHSSPAVAGNFVYVGLRDGSVISLQKDTGVKHWQYKTGNIVDSSPGVYKGVLYVGGADGRLYALDAATGKERWNYLTRGRITSDPAVNQEVVAVVTEDSNLYIIELATGRKRFEFQSFGIAGSPTLHKGLVFISDTSGHIRAIDWRTRDRPFEKTLRNIKIQLFISGFLNHLPRPEGFVWGFQKSHETFVGTPAVADDTVYIGSGSGTLFALEEYSGTLRWQFKADSSLTTSPSVSGKTVFIGDENGILYAIDTLSGQLKWKFSVDGSLSSTPVIANGNLYLTTLTGTVYALE